MQRRHFLRACGLGTLAATAAMGTLIAGTAEAEAPGAKATLAAGGVVTSALTPLPSPRAEHLTWLVQKHALNAALSRQGTLVKRDAGGSLTLGNATFVIGDYTAAN